MSSYAHAKVELRSNRSADVAGAPGGGQKVNLGDAATPDWSGWGFLSAQTSQQATRMTGAAVVGTAKFRARLPQDLNPKPGWKLEVVDGANDGDEFDVLNAVTRAGGFTQLDLQDRKVQ